MPEYYLDIKDKTTGKTKTVKWDKERDPSDEELEALANTPTPAPSFGSKLLRGAKTMVGDVGNAALGAGEMVINPWGKAADLSRDLSIEYAKEGAGSVALSGVEAVTGLPIRQTYRDYQAGKYPEAIGHTLAGIGMGYAAHRMGKSAREVGTGAKIEPVIDTNRIPEINLAKDAGNGKPIGPVIDTPFESLSKNPETPTIDLQSQRLQPELNLEFDPKEVQQTLPYRYYKDRYEGKFDVTGPQQPELFDVPRANETVVTRPMVPSELEPRIAGSDRPTWSRFAEQRELPLEYDVIGQAETSGIPELQRAAKQVVESEAVKNDKTTFSRSEGYKNPDKGRGTFGNILDDNFKSNYSMLVNDSPAGKKIANLLDKYRTETGRTSGEISEKLKAVANPLNRAQFSEFQTLLDKGGMSNDPMVSLALDTARSIDNSFTQRITNSGLHLKDAEGNIVPFTGKENYWPRMYEPSMFADKPALIERLIKNGMSPEAASKAVGNMRRFGERLIDPQHQRVLDLPEHRKDLGALLKHYDDMSHRVAASEILGVKDIADPNSTISQLVTGTKDVGRVTKILTQYLDRDSGVAPYEADFAKQVSRFTTLFYLSKFAISNTNQMMMTPVLTSFSTTGKAFKAFLSSPKKAWSRAEAHGALQTVLQESMREVGGESTVSKMYGIKASEGSNRTISAIAGELYVQDLFKKLKKNPTNQKIRKSLEDLTFDNADELLAQDELTPKQISYGAVRTAEKTQGRAQSLDLPYNWDRSPYINLLLLYKKFAFVQGRLIKDAVKTNPARNIPLLLALFQAGGEATGDAKAALSGSITGDPGKAIEDRGQYVGTDSKALNRIIQNYADSMFLGLAGDAMQATKSGAKGLYQFAAGPVASLGIETTSNIRADIANPPSSINKSQTARGLASRVPYFGSAINRKMRNPNPSGIQ